MDFHNMMVDVSREEEGGRRKGEGGRRNKCNKKGEVVLIFGSLTMKSILSIHWFPSVGEANARSKEKWEGERIRRVSGEHKESAHKEGL